MEESIQLKSPNMRGRINTLVHHPRIFSRYRSISLSDRTTMVGKPQMLSER